jgi:peptidoglycan L-alanyl-D-glutamate endopeptidase CwlK
MIDEKKTCRDIDELLPVAQKACKLFLEECKKANLDIFVTETYRSQARQNYLYEQGRTRPGDEITWTKNSNHTGRLAWDIAVNKPKSLYDVSTLNKAGEIAKKLRITWGGTWEGKKLDRPHFEVSKNWVEPNCNDTGVDKPNTSIKPEVISKDIVPYPGKPLKVGSKGKDVERIQRALNVSVTGVFDGVTARALVEYQDRKGLVKDAVCGPITWTMLF